MGNITQLICEPTLKNDKKLKQICQPLLQGFRLDAFWYYSLSKDGEFSYVGNNPSIADFFFSCEIYKGHPYFKHPKLQTTGFFFADKTMDEEYLQTQGKMRKQFSLDQNFMITNLKQGNIEGYGFATTLKIPDFTNTFINNLFFFRKFIKYFHHESEKIFKEMKACSVDIAKVCGMSFHTPTNYFNNLQPAINLHPFMTGINSFQLEALNSLTLKEKETLRWFLKGRSARQIGKMIHVSVRTAEFYLENIKNKLGCSNKQELFDSLLEWKEFLNLTFF